MVRGALSHHSLLLVPPQTPSPRGRERCRMFWTFGRTWRRPCPACGAPRCLTGEDSAPPSSSPSSLGAPAGRGAAPGAAPAPHSAATPGSRALQRAAPGEQLRASSGCLLPPRGRAARFGFALEGTSSSCSPSPPPTAGAHRAAPNFSVRHFFVQKLTRIFGIPAALCTSVSRRERSPGIRTAACPDFLALPTAALRALLGVRAAVPPAPQQGCFAFPLHSLCVRLCQIPSAAFSTQRSSANPVSCS